MRRRSAALSIIGLGVVLGGSIPAAAQPADPPNRAVDVLIELTRARLATADDVAAAKWGTPTPIDDPAREAHVYRQMAALGAAHGVSADRITSVFVGQIEASKLIQHGLHAQWRVVPTSAPTTRPDLTAVRPVIDGLGVAIVNQLATHRTLLHGKACGAAVADGAIQVIRRTHADPLHGAALLRAVAPLCEPG